MDEIPIRINRKDSNPNEIMFKILPIEKKLIFSTRREKTFHSTEKQPYVMKNQRKHDTLDARKMKGQNRYRRISSSGGTHKFPKDFFNLNDLPKSPIKIRFSRTKKQNIDLFQSANTQNQTNLDSKQSNHFNQYKKKKYTLQSPQRNCQQQQIPSQVQTPKFNLKFFADQDFCEAKSKTTNRKIKLDEYLSHKKEQFPNFFKRVDKKLSKDQNFQVNQKSSNRKINQKTTLFEITSNQNNQNQLLLETLGKHDKVTKQPSIETQKRPRIQSNMEKQNHKLFEPIKTNKKCIKAFLSTKGLNWKILQKINQMNDQPVKTNNTISLNLRDQRNISSLRKGLSQKLDANQNILCNTFRIKKCP